ncbi:MAG: hypothetical protein ACXWKP_33900, partial [Bradyrhizobium sp.]
LNVFKKSAEKIHEGRFRYVVCSSFGLRSNVCYAACVSLQWQWELQQCARPSEGSPWADSWRWPSDSRDWLRCLLAG